MRPRGLSLAEVLVAVAVLAVGVLSLAGAIVFSLRTQSRAGRASQALYYANQLIEISKARNLPGSAPVNEATSSRLSLNAAPFAQELYADDLFRRSVQTTRLVSSSGDYRNKLYRLDVTVFWFEQGHEDQVKLSALHRVP